MRATITLGKGKIIFSGHILGLSKNNNNIKNTVVSWFHKEETLNLMYFGKNSMLNRVLWSFKDVHEFKD